MNKLIIDDDFLYSHMPAFEEYILEKIPDEKDIKHIFSKKFEHKMKALLKYEKRTPFYRRAVIYSKRAAVIVLILTSIALTGVMSVEAYRVKLFQILTQVFEEYTSISIIKDGTDDAEIIPIESTYIPEGYTLFDKTITFYEQTITYKNTSDNEIFYSQTVIITGTSMIDAKNVQIEYTNISGQYVNIVEKYNTIQIYWNDSLHSYYITGTADKEELIEMVKSIIEISKK